MNSSGEYTVEYKFTADVRDLEQGVNEVKSLVKDASSAVGKDFKVNWGEGSGSIAEYSKWLETATKQTEGLTGATSSFSLSQSELEAIEKRNAAYMEQYAEEVARLTSNTSEATGSLSGFDGALNTAASSVGGLDLKTKSLIIAIASLAVSLAKTSLDAFAKYEDAVYGMATTVANVGGTISQAMDGIREATANGLLSDTDAARAINNLTNYGYSVSEATSMIEALTTVSMAHRNSTMSVSDQVERLTEGIMRGSSQMLKSNGLMVTATSAQASYASSIGKTASELTDAEKSQAMYNAVILQGQKNASVAASYQNSYTAATQRLSNAISNLKVSFGQVLAPVISGLATLLTFLANAVNKVLGTMSSSLDIVADSTADASDSMDDFTEAVAGGGGGGGAVGAVRDLSDELAKLERQYKDELKQIEQRHQETIDRLTQQIYEANVDYRRAIDERNAEFAVSQAKEEKKHQEKVDDIMTQIAFLQRYNNDYNKQKLANLEFALAKENALYQKQTQAAKEQLDLQNEYDRKSYEEKRAQYQAELDEELAFMEKHRADLQEVRGWILQDEIESLKQRYEEQKKSYEEQATGAYSGGADVGSNYMSGMKSAIDSKSGEVKAAYTTLADEVGKSFEATILDWVGKAIAWMTKAMRDAWDWFMHIGEHIENLGKNIGEGIDSYFTNLGKRLKTVGDVIRGFIGAGYATGGYTGQGNPNEVAGVVHKGEYVLPQEMVDQNTGTPKALGNTYNIYVEGTFATSAAERRKVADQIVAAINQNNKSRLEASWQ